MKWRIGSLARMVAISACVGVAGAPSAVAHIEIKEANLSLSEQGRPSPPVITIKFYENINNWDATGLPVVFRLRLYAKVNVGSYLVNYVVHLPDPSNDTNARLSASFSRWKEPLPRIVRLDPIVGLFPSNRLGTFTAAAIGVCRHTLPSGIGDRLLESTMRVKLSLTAVPSQFSTKYRYFPLDRAITVFIRCQGLPASQKQKPSGPRREIQLHVTDAAMEVSKFSRECPRRIFVRVTLRANTDGRVRYTLHRSDGPEQPQEMVIRWQGGNRYKGSFDHQFDVPVSRVVTVWVEHKGRRMTGERRINVDCSRPWEPKGVYIE